MESLMQLVVILSFFAVVIAFAFAVEVYFHINIGLAGNAVYSSFSTTCNNDVGDFIPIHGFRQLQRLARKIFRKFYIRIAVTYNIAGSQVVIAVHIFFKHCRTRLARRRVVFGERAIDKYLAELYTFIFQGAYNEVLYRPKGFLRKRSCSQPVLVRYHYEFIIGKIRYLA